LWHSPLGRHGVHVGVALVAGREGEPLPVRREGGMGLGAGAGSEPPHVAAAQVAGPQVPGVDEGDLPRADRRVGQQPGVMDVRVRAQGQSRRGEKGVKKDGTELHWRPPSALLKKSGQTISRAWEWARDRNFLVKRT